MDTAEMCSECGQPIPTGGPGGFCPKCLLGLGLDATIDAAATTVPTLPITEKPGDRIGRYRLLQEIGQGGCGVVYMAEQEEPFHRRVALKVIKLGMDTKQVIARFAAERQALAMMDHPNIAKVLDAGATDTGRPFFVMELVRGIRITDYCDQNKLSTADRLALCIQVCQAIQHAHQKGIIHRDIKPSNVLVTLHDGVPVPKVIDFGIAKATQGRLTDHTLFTAFEQFVGTPAYMSPEQVELSGLDIDTRSDIYSLGVLLHELLVGATPFDTRELLAAGLEHLRRTIREQEPVRPSTRLATMVQGTLATTADRRRTDPPRLIHQIRGDLDWIVMKCLEKDRTRRYDTANALALDLQRHLGHEPVSARPPSPVYRFRKFVGRNKVIVTSAALLALMLIASVLASTAFAVKAARDARLAKTEGERAAAAAENLRQNLYVADIGLAFQAWDRGEAARARELLQHQVPAPGETDLRTFEWRYLAGLIRTQELATFKSISAEVWGTAISPDGRFLATGGNDGRAQIWDLQTRQPLARFSTGAGDCVYTVAFSPDGRILATPNATRTIYLWDVETQTLKTRLEGHTKERAVSVAFSPDGRFIVSTAGVPYDLGTPGEIILWDAGTFDLRARFTGHQASIGMAAFSPDSSRLATPMGDGTILLWDIPSGRIMQQFGRHQGLVWSAAFSPDGKLLASSGHDGSVRLWEIQTGQLAALLGTHAGPAYTVAFSHDGRHVASASLDHTAKVWDVASTRELARLQGHSGRVWSVNYAPDGRHLITGSIDGTARLWPTPTAESSSTFVRHSGAFFTSLGFSPDGRWLFREAGGQLTLWNRSNQTEIVNLPTTGAAFSPNGIRLATVNRGNLEIWDPSPELPRLLHSLPAGITGNLTLPTFSPDGETLAVIRRPDTLALWRIDDGREMRTIQMSSPDQEFVHAQFSPGETFFASSHANGEVNVWRVDDWSRQTVIPATGQANQSFGFSPDGRWLAVAGRDAVIVLCEVATGRLHRLRGDGVSIWSLAFTHDSKTLAAGNHDGHVKFWNLLTHREVTTLRAHQTILCSLAFSPDGNTLATLSIDGTMHLSTAPSFAEAAASFRDASRSTAP